MFRIIISLITLLSFTFLLILLNITTPVNAGPFGILVILILAYLVSLGLTTLLVFLLSCLASKLSILMVARKPIERLNFKKSYYYSTILAAVPIIFIGLQSVGSVGVYELLLMFIFTAIGVLYISKKNE